MNEFDALEPFADLVRHSWWIVSQVSDDRLQEIASECKRVTKTNCPASTFFAAGLIEREVEFERRRRAHAQQQESDHA